jgi:hypothetical protein
MSRFCEQCGAPLVPGTRFCERCGRPVAPTPSYGPPSSSAKWIWIGGAILAVLAIVVCIGALALVLLGRGTGPVPTAVTPTRAAALASPAITPLPTNPPTSRPPQPSPAVLSPSATSIAITTPSPQPTYTPYPTHAPLPSTTTPPTAAAAEYDLYIKRMDFQPTGRDLIVGKPVQFNLLIVTDIWPKSGPLFPAMHFRWRPGPGFDWMEGVCPADMHYAKCAPSFEFTYAQPGQYEVEVQADSRNEVPETNETNNARSWTIEVFAAPPAPTAPLVTPPLPSKELFATIVNEAAEALGWSERAESTSLSGGKAHAEVIHHPPSPGQCPDPQGSDTYFDNIFVENVEEPGASKGSVIQQVPFHGLSGVLEIMDLSPSSYSKTFRWSVGNGIWLQAESWSLCPALRGAGEVDVMPLAEALYAAAARHGLR